MLSDVFIAEIRNSVSLLTIVQHKVKLIKRGKNHVGLCPFHSEKTPSFHVIEDQGNYHCFGCGAHGDIISFIRQTETLTFMEAIEKIAQISGIIIPTLDNFDNKEYSKRKTILKILDIAATYFSNELELPSGRNANKYLMDRGVNKKLRLEFRIGYAPSEGLKSKLISAGFNENQILEAGLIKRLENSNKIIDIFRNRIIFSIFDNRKQVIAFGARALFETNAKYINSPNTELFKKSNTLYGLSQFKEMKTITGKLLVVEGYMDVISINKTNIASAVAPLGTAISEKQIDLIWSLNKKPILCFDGDKAGKLAAWRFIKRVIPILKVGLEVCFCLLPEGKDPDDMIQNNEIEDFKKVIESPSSLIDTIWLMLLEKYDISNVDSKANLWMEAKNLVREFNDKTLKNAYFDEVSYRIRLMRSKAFSNLNKRENNRPSVGKEELNNALLSILYHHPKLALDHSEQLLQLNIKDESKCKMISLLLDLIITNETLDRDEFYNHLNSCGLGYLSKSFNDPSVIRRIGFNPADFKTELIEDKFIDLLNHALKVFTRI